MWPSSARCWSARPRVSCCSGFSYSAARRKEEVMTGGIDNVVLLMWYLPSCSFFQARTSKKFVYANFAESPECELRRIPILGTSVYRGAASLDRRRECHASVCC